jgi:hypothetical protein
MEPAFVGGSRGGFLVMPGEMILAVQSHAFRGGIPGMYYKGRYVIYVNQEKYSFF